MYAIIDIETTGGKFNEEGITEIAIYRFDGLKIKDQFSSLVNPLREIQPFVEKLTGINSNMLRNAPKFFEVAKRIVEITNGCILVAHNAVFDYRVLKTEFRRLGYDFNSKSICTVSLSKKLIPDLPSYKLDKLVKSLGIPFSNHHRASSDALATLKLFEILLSKDSAKKINATFIKDLNPLLPKPKYLAILDLLETEIGVYYLYDNLANIFFIGKSKNIKKRVLKHLTSTNQKDLKIQKLISKVKYDPTGSELISILKEKNDISNINPKLNNSSEMNNYKFGIKLDSNKLYYNLIIEKINISNSYLEIFNSQKKAIRKLNFWIEKFCLCVNHTSIKVNSGKSCFSYITNKCNGACNGSESFKCYNLRITSLIQSLSYSHKDFLLIDKGYNSNLKSFIWIEDFKLKGYGYFKLNHQINNRELLSKLVVSVKETYKIKKLIKSFISKKKYKNLLELD